MEYSKEVELIKNGEIGVIPTDTIYGLVCSAFSPSAVERIYQLKKRDSRKPLIVLISTESDIEKFNIKPDAVTKEIFKKYWPGPVSIVVPCESKSFSYLHRGTGSIAFRLPKQKWLIEFLRETGPIVAPSANLEGEPPAKTIEEAKKYFGANVSFIIDKGELNGKPSTIISVVDSKEKQMR
ncbi:MAG: L-threonylcarbamoyladenylate synthase [Patescibacteria group bacterium]